MSWKLAMAVFESALPPRLKPTAALLALFADDTGHRIYPSVGRLAWLIGKSERAISSDLSELVSRGVLVALTPRTGGRRRTTEYKLQTLPKREDWTPQSRSAVHPERTRNPEAGIRVSAD